MGYCHKCQHDCTEKDPCPCCRKGPKPYRPWFEHPYIPTPLPGAPYDIPNGIRFTTPDLKPKTGPSSKIFTGVQ